MYLWPVGNDPTVHRKSPRWRALLSTCRHWRPDEERPLGDIGTCAIRKRGELDGGIYWRGRGMAEPVTCHIYSLSQCCQYCEYESEIPPPGNPPHEAPWRYEDQVYVGYMRPPHGHAVNDYVDVWLWRGRR